MGVLSRATWNCIPGASIVADIALEIGGGDFEHVGVLRLCGLHKRYELHDLSMMEWTCSGTVDARPKAGHDGVVVVRG